MVKKHPGVAAPANVARGCGRIRTQWRDRTGGSGSSAAMWGEKRRRRRKRGERGRERGEKARVDRERREREREGEGGRGRALSVTLSSIMAPIGLKAVVGESKILLFLLGFVFDMLGGCSCVRKKRIWRVLLRVFGKLRMFPTGHLGGGDDDDDEGDDEGRCWVVSYCKAQPQQLPALRMR